MEKTEKFINQIIEGFKFYKKNWNYEDGCIYIGAEDLYKVTQNEKYYNFIKENIDKRLTADGVIKGYDKEEYNIDNICSGRVLYTLYDKTGDKKYKNAIENIYEQIKTHPRTKEQNFWHKRIYPNQVWLDGLYMALPFYTEYEKRFNENKNLNDIFQQIRNVKKNMSDSETGLYYHGYDESRLEKWSDRLTGTSRNFWLRSMGWYVMALIDIIEKLDEKEKMKKIMEKLFIDSIEALLKFQDESGLWYQIINKKGNPKNYPETSGSLMIIYSILKGVRLSILKRECVEKAKKGFAEITEKYLKEENGKIYLYGICGVAGLGNIPYRDGSEEYYYSEKIILNDYKGTGAFMMAYSEMFIQK